MLMGWLDVCIQHTHTTQVRLYITIDISLGIEVGVGGRGRVPMDSERSHILLASAVLPLYKGARPPVSVYPIAYTYQSKAVTWRMAPISNRTASSVRRRSQCITDECAALNFGAFAFTCCYNKPPSVFISSAPSI